MSAAQPNRRWKADLSQLGRCIFPASEANSVPHVNETRAIPVPVQNVACPDGVAQEHIVHLAWALVLRCYVGTNSVSFASIGHHDGDGDLQSDPGPRMKDSAYVRVCHAEIDCRSSLNNALSTWELSSSREYYPLESVQDAHNLEDELVFNTAVSFAGRLCSTSLLLRDLKVMEKSLGQF